MPKPDITIGKTNADGFSRDILVDGVMWGRAIRHSHGPRGNSYTFQDALRNTVFDERGVEARVWGNKIEQRQKGGMYAEKVADIEDRLVVFVRVAIERGMLKSPDILRAEAEKARNVWRATREKIERDETDKFRAKAEDTLVKLGLSISTPGNVEAIVAAMKWAQTQ